MYSLLFAGVAAFLLSLLITPAVCRLSRRWGAVDHPDAMRKMHQQAVPNLGGIAIVLSYSVSFVLLLALQTEGANIVVKSIPLAVQFLPAAILIFATGLVDDLSGLKPWQKLAGQVAASAGAYWAGVHVQGFGGYQLGHWWSFPLTMLWLIVCTNALNLIDGVDGLAAGLGLFATCTTLIAALLQHNVPLALATVPLAGALLGFLRYNFNPATIFLGDSGSLFVGFLLGCYGVLWSQKSVTILGMTAPLMALSIPLLDTALAITRRFLRQQPIFSADRRHIHHRLLDRGFTPRKVALLLYACCGLGALCSLAMMRQKFNGPMVVIFCLIAWIGIERLGYVEFGTAARMFTEGAFRGLLSSQIALNGFEERLVAASTSEECWSVIRTAAQDFGFHDVEMHLAGRTFYHRNGLALHRCWNMRIPISDSDYIELTREFEAAQAGTVAPLADIVRRVLAPKLAVLAANIPHLQSASHGD